MVNCHSGKVGYAPPVTDTLTHLPSHPPSPLMYTPSSRSHNTESCPSKADGTFVSIRSKKTETFAR